MVREQYDDGDLQENLISMISEDFSKLKFTKEQGLSNSLKRNFYLTNLSVHFISVLLKNRAKFMKSTLVGGKVY